MIRSRPSGLLMRTGRLCSVFSFKHGAVDSYCLSAGVPYALLKRTSGLLQYIVPMCHTVTRSSANRLIVFLRLRWLPFFFLFFSFIALPSSFKSFEQPKSATFATQFSPTTDRDEFSEVSDCEDTPSHLQRLD